VRRLFRALRGLCLGAGLAASATAGAGQMDIATFNLLRPGMSEAEVLVRAGPPDLDTSVAVESVERERGFVSDDEVDLLTRKRVVPVKELHYIPGPGEHDPHLTIVTIRGGLVWSLERIKVFSRHRPPQAGAAPGAKQERRSDAAIKLDRAERTLDAAERYAEIRARLREAAREEARRAAEAGVLGEGAEIYRVTQPDGSVYFGDRPPEPDAPDPGQEGAP